MFGHLGLTLLNEEEVHIMILIRLGSVKIKIGCDGESIP